MNVNLEDRLTDSLNQKAAQSDRVAAAPHESWQRASAHRHRRRTVRVLTSGISVMALLLSGVAVYALREHRREPVIANETFDPDFRLMPTWLPDGVPSDSLVRFDPEFFEPSAHTPARRRRQWARGDQSIVLEDGPRPSWVQGAPVNLNEAMNQMTGCEVCSLMWPVGDGWFWLYASRAVARDDLVAFANSLRVDGVRAEVPSAPLSLPLVFDKEEVVRFDEGPIWNLQSSTGISGRFSVFVNRLDSDFERFNHPGQPWADGKLVRVRSRDARLLDVTTRHFVTWHERGWAITVVSDTGDNAFRVAQSMSEVSVAVFNQLRSTDSSPPEVPRKPRSERETPTRQVLTPALAGLDATVRVAETETKAGCVQLVLVVGGQQEKLCVRISPDLVLWQGVRLVDGRDVLIVIGGPNVDALRLVTRESQLEPGEVVAKEVGATLTEVVSVESADERQYRWIGIAVVQVDGSATDVELFSNVVEESTISDIGDGQDAGSVADEQLDETFPEAVEPDPGDRLLTSLGRVPIVR